MYKSTVFSYLEAWLKTLCLSVFSKDCGHNDPFLATSTGSPERYKLDLTMPLISTLSRRSTVLLLPHLHWRLWELQHLPRLQRHVPSHQEGGGRQSLHCGHGVGQNVGCHSLIRFSSRDVRESSGGRSGSGQITYHSPERSGECQGRENSCFTGDSDDVAEYPGFSYTNVIICCCSSDLYNSS